MGGGSHGLGTGRVQDATGDGDDVVFDRVSVFFPSLSKSEDPRSDRPRTEKNIFQCS